MHQLNAVTPEQFFAERLAADPSRPFVTFYDEASGDRAELSVKSLANWVAKTHFLLSDELGLGVGDAALVALPAHWISVPAVLGCLTAGLSLTTDPGDAFEAAVAFVEPDTVASALAVPDAYCVAPASAAVGFGDHAPAGTNDYVAAVRPQADAWAGVRMPAAPTDNCLDGATRADVVDRARARAAELGMTAGARVLVTRPWGTAYDLLDTLLAPLVMGGSVVYLRPATATDAAALAALVERRTAQERATVHLP